ncbi:eukaryotic and archaeal DNA primase, large subunit-domain-containing protein [Lineolata rhizophorae]|uniref:DNA primase large subunit n=1 Tax=Lineolata rhizophorae TaxID=578093 RepID=A0A6A6PCU7_9PEZI|nr:eukaryotic and archaeal DNA primase, large subunit-domain-containing protein [Lineolata rhizophorae]
MIRHDYNRIDPKRRPYDFKKKQFAQAEYKQQDYAHRLNFYTLPPTAEITLEQFEEWAIQRLKILAELETCTFRNKTFEETTDYISKLLEKHLPLHANSSRSTTLQDERRRDHYSHFILRLAFSRSADLRARFARLESALFRIRLRTDDTRERQAFIDSLDLQWEKVGVEERRELAAELGAVLTQGLNNKRAAQQAAEEEMWVKVDWEQVPELVESRRVFVKKGKAYVPGKEQTSLVVGEFTRRLEAALDLTSKALPGLDEDDRLTPILNHLSNSFTTPDAAYSSDTPVDGLGAPTADQVDALSKHFPLCMKEMHIALRRDAKLKYDGREQYSVFLKGLGLSLPEALTFWRRSFRTTTDDDFNKNYRYNVRWQYGDVGGDANRRAHGRAPKSCQRLLTEPLPKPGQTHGCPYRTYARENLERALKDDMGVRDPQVLAQVRDDVGRQRYHVACNRVFEHLHAREIKKVKDENIWGAAELDTILHPNTYFKRSFLLKQLGQGGGSGAAIEVKREQDETMVD